MASGTASGLVTSSSTIYSKLAMILAGLSPEVSDMQSRLCGFFKGITIVVLVISYTFGGIAVI